LRGKLDGKIKAIPVGSAHMAQKELGKKEYESRIGDEGTSKEKVFSFSLHFYVMDFYF
jgi:hypothetical protein